MSASRMGVAIVARLLVGAFAIANLNACQSVSSASEPAQAFPPSAWLASCNGHDGWDEPGPPFQIFGNTYYVGTCGIAAVLITGNDGNVLIDGGTEAGGHLIAANIRMLGLDLADVKILLSSHEHFDHVGGLAFLQEASGAKVLASKRATHVMRSGVADPEDPQAGSLPAFRPVAISELLPDGEVVRLGNLAITAIATPGHSPGAMSWTWESCVEQDCRRIAYLDSLSAVSSAGYRFSDHPESVDMFRASLDKVDALECDIVLSPHPSSSRMGERIASGDLASGMDCRAYAAAAAARLDARLAEEAGE